jgi:predicted outer membrane repeat protein
MAARLDIATTPHISCTDFFGDAIMNFLRSRIIALALTTAFGANAQAAIFTVGTPSGPGQPCTHGTIQSAITAANNSAGADTIRLTRSLTYEPEANTINTGQELTIEGGYATCDQVNSDTTNTIVSGAGGAHAPVFSITAPTGALIHLRRLTIRGGDVDGSGNGGGIFFEGDGVLEITDSLITQNTAGFGGGIYAKGTASNAELVLGANVVVSSNTARYDGGGVLAYGIEMSMLDPGSNILLNHALGTGSYGRGGGLYVYAGDRPSYAYIGSGSGLFGAIYANDARLGGGVAIVSAGTDAAELQLFTTAPAYQAAVIANTASEQGGGIYTSSSQAKARLWNAVLDSNDAPNGAAAYMAAGSGLYVNFAGLPEASTGCIAGTDCGRITNNTADTDTSSHGAIIYGESGTTIQFGYLPTAAPADARGGVLIHDNEACSVFGGAGTTQIHRSVISDNITSADLITQSSNPLSLVDSTIAGNAIGGGSAILRTVNSAVTIQRSILWQPGSTSLSRSGGSLTIYLTDASENTSLGGGLAAYTFDPLFIDPAHGDYGLRVGSGAIDFAPAVVGNERDAYSQLRDVDLPNPDYGGTRDIGALERQSLQPIVLNGDFDYSDLRLWTKFDGAWDGTQNIVGGAGSGSWKYSISDTNATDVIVADQCIVLPAAGTYLLNGWGKGGGSTFQTRDYAIVKWEVREQTDGTCTAGVVASGELTLGYGTSWGHPAQPASIDLPEAQFGDQLSIRLILVAHDGGVTASHSISAWFDGITLEVEPSDVIFKDGFE